MINGADKDERKRQKEILREYFKNTYDPKHHDVFVVKYNQELEKAALISYIKERGIISADKIN
jgi:hypothetical protein